MGTKSYFLINGYKVEYHKHLGMAEFHQWGLYLKVDPAHFTYDWVTRMSFRLSGLAVSLR
jgi:hypothetical protein